MKYIILFIVLTCLLSLYLFHLPKIMEGYESLEECKKQGYPNNFCMHVPIQSMITTAPDLHE